MITRLQRRTKTLGNHGDFDLLRTLFHEDRVVYAKKPFGGPEHVLHYLARYTHRVAISNHRLIDVTDTQVTFRWKDYAHHSKRRIMTLTHEEFLRRFVHTRERRCGSKSWHKQARCHPGLTAVSYHIGPGA